MNNNYYKNFSFNQSNLGCFLNILLVGIILTSLGLGWIVNGFFIILALLVILPVIAWFVLRWWLQRNLIQGDCPVCSYQLTGINGNQLQCPNCGEMLKVEEGIFQRLTPPGTIDVEAIEVNSDQ